MASVFPTAFFVPRPGVRDGDEVYGLVLRDVVPGEDENGVAPWLRGDEE